MNVTVNNKTLSLLVNDLKSNDDIIEFLNSVIDEEFEKERMKHVKIASANNIQKLMND